MYYNPRNGKKQSQNRGHRGLFEAFFELMLDFLRKRSIVFDTCFPSSRNRPFSGYAEVAKWQTH